MLETYEDLLKRISASHPAMPRFDWTKGISKETMYDVTLSLRSKIRIGLGVADYEAGYPGSEALYVDEEEFDKINGEGKFQEIVDFWNEVSAGSY
mgnify:CR=1 FL=1